MIEDFSKYKFFYVNGCSFTEGGGLEEPHINKNSIIPLYKKFYGIEWRNRNQVNYGKRLEEIIDIKCINDAKSGSGTDRLVRTTYDFIFKNWKDKDKFFIILEKPDSSRSDVFYTKKNKYFIVNLSVQNDNNFIFKDATIEYYNKRYETNKDDLKLFEEWSKNHYSFEEKTLQDEKAFLGLYSFCKLHSIKIFIMQPNNCIFTECFDKNDIIKFSKINQIDSIDNWCFINKMTIKDELDGLTNDAHPGFFGHIEYAKELAKFLGWNKKYPNFPNYKKILNLKKDFL